MSNFNQNLHVASRGSETSPHTPSAISAAKSFPEAQEEDIKTVIHGYCEKKLDEGYTKCIWICMRRGKRWVATDINPSEKGNNKLSIDELRKLCSWWKRNSLYSAVGVKEIMFRFAKYDKTRNEIIVFIRDFDYDSRFADIQSAIEHSGPIKDPWECGVDIMGNSHDPNADCPNSAWDEIERTTYCPIQRSRKWELQRDIYNWLPAMLECYWQEGMQSDELKFLENANFVTQYKDLAWDPGWSALIFYGKTVYGFQLIEGWRIRYLLFLVMASLFLSSCVVAISTAVLHSFQAGLTAGSYALAIAAVLLGVLTFLSAIL